MSQRVLVVEDDENLRLALRDNLEDEGYAVGEAATARAARAALAGEPWALVILDVMLPDGDGYTLCRELRAAGRPTRVLMLTARSLEEDFVRGLDEGADDYLAKPYRLKELLARVRALLRRGEPVAAARASGLEFGGFRLDPTARLVYDAGGAALELTRTEFDLLHCLVRHRGQALRRDDILDEVWGADVVVDERTVDNFVSNLKKKLRWEEPAPWRIKAVRGVGYRMEID